MNAGCSQPKPTHSYRTDLITQCYTTGLSVPLLRSGSDDRLSIARLTTWSKFVGVVLTREEAWLMELKVTIESSVVVAGENFSCRLSFTNTTTQTQTIAWAGAQLHCQCCHKKEVVKLPSAENGAKAGLSSPVTSTAFFPNRGEKGVTVLSTPSTVLFCNLTLQSGDTHSVLYRERLPRGGPPSFNGRLIRYIYKLAVGAQKPNSATQITRLPVWVITVPDHLQSTLATSPSAANPFMSAVSKETHSPTGESSLEIVTIEASRRATASTTLMASGAVLGRIVLFRAAYRLGDEVMSVFDCSHSTQPCLQVTSSLLCEEIIQDACLQQSSSVKSYTTIISQETKCCQNTAITQFSLPIPSSLTQGFENDTVKLTWRVHYQLLFSRGSWSDLMSSSQPQGVMGTRPDLLVGPLTPAADSVTWEAPITILPSLLHPQQRQHNYTLSL